MTSLADAFEAEADGQIEFAVMGSRYPATESSVSMEDCVSRPVSWARARAILDYEPYDASGGMDLHPVYAWTATLVLFVHEYDGGISVRSVPRHPIPCRPGFGGSYCGGAA